MDLARIILTITQTHIDDGKPLDAAYCVVKLALDDVLDYPSSRSRVTAKYVCYIQSEWEHKLSYNSKRLEEFINRFDRGLIVKPGTFRAYVPKEWIKD